MKFKKNVFHLFPVTIDVHTVFGITCTFGGYDWFPRRPC